MGRVSTWVLVAGIVALGLTAAVDALERGDDGARRVPRDDAAGERVAEPSSWRRAAAAELADHGIRGTLVWIDARCRTHAFRLPTLAKVEPSERRSCGPNGPRLLPPTGRRPGSAGWEDLGEGRPVLSGLALLRALGRNAAIVRDQAGRGSILAVFRRRRLVGAPPFAYGSLERLRVSPYRTYAAAAIGGRGLVIVDTEGRLQPDGLSGAHAVAWSPDETWTAMARRDAVYLFETGARAVSLIRLPIRAADLGWR
jgi:hypothetical protein